jgi:hypothetical protein
LQVKIAIDTQCMHISYVTTRSGCKNLRLHTHKYNNRKHNNSIRVTRLTCLFKPQQNCPPAVHVSYAWRPIDSSDYLLWKYYSDIMTNEVNCHILFPHKQTRQQSMHQKRQSVWLQPALGKYERVRSRSVCHSTTQIGFIFGLH